MPRKRSQQPDYLFHVSGQARVQFGPRTFYLGKYGTPESRAKYYRLLAKYADNDFQPFDDDDETEHQAEQEMLVRHITADFRAEVLPQYSGGHENRLRNLLVLLDERYGDRLAEDFGPRSLGDLRKIFIKLGNSRKYVNLKVRDIVRIPDSKTLDSRPPP